MIFTKQIAKIAIFNMTVLIVKKLIRSWLLVLIYSSISELKLLKKVVTETILILKKSMQKLLRNFYSNSSFDHSIYLIYNKIC